MKKIGKAGIILLAVFCTTMFFGCADGGQVRDQGEVMSELGTFEEGQSEEIVERWTEEKRIWAGTIDDPFTGNHVVVIMDKSYSGINKEHDKSFFGDIDIESICDVSRITTEAGLRAVNIETFRQTLEITLPIDCKENVIRVIRHLEKIEGIYYAGPNHIGAKGPVPIIYDEFFSNFINSINNDEE